MGVVARRNFFDCIGGESPGVGIFSHTGVTSRPGEREKGNGYF